MRERDKKLRCVLSLSTSVVVKRGTTGQPGLPHISLDPGWSPGFINFTMDSANLESASECRVLSKTAQDGVFPLLLGFTC